ncbi:cysteine desulfurase-like protein [Luteipulveratus flavus]|uniref:Cysteine desulfurase-like protein n=1 Tax=Luteipulveratus flavus TaxID=3031728 RepID=A0ABT6C385_9MICO|nr:cysteine desulfurase-like protein [Luteipulveratus sp. YIM 133296]MDF8263190.1 cysteine desulfurase-like protein [Luteipulveratus sp. YIM 133296]
MTDAGPIALATATRYDVDRVRSHFPSLAGGTAYFDGPGGSQTPDVVGRAIADTMTGPISNRGSVTASECVADAVVVAARQALADLLGGEPGGVVLGRSMTQNTFDLARTLAKRWSPGDEVVVSRLDHDANIRPWVLAAQAREVQVRWADFDPTTGELEPAQVERVLGPRTRLVAVTGASNLIGTRPDIPGIAEVVHAAGALLHVDGVHLTPHAPVDVRALGADFFACSPYKFLGPHHGVLYGRPELLEELEPDKLVPSSDRVPERFELGTLPYELLAGTTAAIDFLAGLAPGSGTGRRSRLLASMTALEQHEAELLRRLETGAGELPGVTVWSRAARRTPTLLLTFDGHEATAVRDTLAAADINAPAGHFYALDTSRHLGLGDTGGLRIGLAPYTSADDVDRLLAQLARTLKR